MKKKLLTIILSVTMVFTATVTPVVVEANALSYINTAKTAVNTTNTLLKSIGVDKTGTFGKSFTTFLGTLSTGLGFTNTILKFLGFGKKSGPDINALMYEEIKQMHTDLLNIGQDVRNLTDTMSDYIIEDKFDKQMDAARNANKNWYNFNQTYVEQGMEYYKEQYTSLVNNELKKWWQKPEDRDDNDEGINNSQIILAYDSDNELILHDQNNAKDIDCSSYIVLTSEILPQNNPRWNVNNYEENLSNTIKTQLNAAIDRDLTIDRKNIILNEETIDSLCEDAIEELVYRMSILAVNSNGAFVTNVKSTFNNYCKNLVDIPNEGLDAILQAVMLTNNFEGEARETYQQICTNLIIQTGEYATFALDVIGKDGSSYISEADTASANWLHVAEQIQSAVDSLTGYDNYCYATGTLVHYIPIKFTLDYRDFYKSFETYVEAVSFLSYDRNKLSSSKVGTEKAMIMSNLFLSKNTSTEDKSFINYLKQFVYGKYKSYYIRPGIFYTEPATVETEIDFDNRTFVIDWDETQKDVNNAEDIALKGKWLGKGSKGDVLTNNKNINYNNVKQRKKLTGDIYTKGNSLYRNKAIIANVVTYNKGVFDDGWCYYGPQDQFITVNNEGANALDCYSTLEAYTIIKEPIPERGKGEGGYNPLDSLQETRDKLDRNPVECLKATTSGSNKIKLSWNKVDGATKYVVYGAKCDNKFKKLATVKSNKYTVNKIKGTKLKAHKSYKFYVIAYEGNKKIVKSKAIHFITGNTMGKYANVKTLKVDNTFISPGVGQTVKIKTSYKVYSAKKHITTKHGAKIRYTSDNPSVASVKSNGEVTGVSIGEATIYVQDVGGKTCKVKVQVIP